MLFDRHIRQVTMVDFEYYGQCTEDHRSTLNVLELLGIF